MLRPADLPPPTAFGAPARYGAWRHAQADAAIRILQSPYRFTGINAPCGTGKTLIPIMVQRLTGARVCVLTANRSLQDAYRDEWGASMGLFDMRGQQNYECLAVRDDGALARYHRGASRVMVDRGPCHAGIWCRLRHQGGCEYFDSQKTASSADLVCTNYDYWFAAGASLGRFDYLFLDEADEADPKLREALKLTLPLPQCRQLLQIDDVPPPDAAVHRWRDWGKAAYRRCADVTSEYLDDLTRDDAIDTSTVAELRKLKDLSETLSRISKLEGEWLVAASRRTATIDFDPVWPTPYAEDWLYRAAERVVLMSATLTRKDMQILDALGSHEFIEYASPFPIANRPVYILDLGPDARVRVDSRLKDYKWLVTLMDSAFSRTLDRKHLVQSVSHKLTEEIMRHSRYRKLMISCHESSDKPAMLAAFRAARPGAANSILVHPGLKAGESFPKEECEVVHIPKMPFLDMRDPIMRRRESEDPEYGGHLMMKAFSQSIGRHVRSDDDRGSAIVYDDHARWAIPKYRRFAPKAAMEGIRWIKAIPEPLPKL